jgi:predicted kinase
MPPALECLIFVGLPGAGKTTLYRERFAATHRHVSKDLWPNASGRDARQQKIIDEALAGRFSVVVDNTNPTVAERAALISLARARGARIVGYFFDVTTRAAVARNASRTGRGKVPNVAIFTAAKRLQQPSLAEGFDQLFRVEIADDRSLRITEIAAAAK